MEPGMLINIDRVLAALEHGSNWSKGAWIDGDGAMSLHAAIHHGHPRHGDAHLIEQVAERNGWGWAFNTHPDTTFSDIERVLRKNRRITMSQMIEVFGPQGNEIVVNTYENTKYTCK